MHSFSACMIPPCGGGGEGHWVAGLSPGVGWSTGMPNLAGAWADFGWFWAGSAGAPVWGGGLWVGGRLLAKSSLHAPGGHLRECVVAPPGAGHRREQPVRHRLRVLGSALEENAAKPNQVIAKMKMLPTQIILCTSHNRFINPNMTTLCTLCGGGVFFDWVGRCVPLCPPTWLLRAAK